MHELYELKEKLLKELEEYGKTDSHDRAQNEYTKYKRHIILLSQIKLISSVC